MMQRSCEQKQESELSGIKDNKVLDELSMKIDGKSDGLDNPKKGLLDEDSTKILLVLPKSKAQNFEGCDDMIKWLLKSSLFQGMGLNPLMEDENNYIGNHKTSLLPHRQGVADIAMVHNIKFQLLDNNALVESDDPYRHRVDGKGEMRQTSWTMTVGLHDCEKIGVQRILQLCDGSINSNFSVGGFYLIEPTSVMFEVFVPPSCMFMDVVDWLIELHVKNGGDVVLQYDFSEGIFEMELEDVDDNEESVEPNDGEFRLNRKSLAGNNNDELVFTFGHLEYWKRGYHLTIKPIPSENLSSGFDPTSRIPRTQLMT
ncbi:hypothetical protein V6N11_030540 [Hibiscus sabdariffa]|uniref:Uncharacterized protein n=1 Tax=Hibiscus sabdariffa TaxID=183260 RepID=A0ABR2N7A1_9ROSI